MRVLFAIFFLASFPASAEPKASVCIELQRILGVVKDCSQNPVFVQAADNCLERISRDVKDSTASLSRALAESSGEANSSQAGRLEESGANLSRLYSKLDQEFTELVYAKQEIDAYREYLVYPGSFSRERVKQLHLDFLFSGFECIALSKHALLERTQVLLDKMVDLTKTELAVESMQKKNAAALAQLGGGSGRGLSSVTAKAAQGSALGAPKVKAGRSPKSESTITGKVPDDKL